MKRRGSSTGKGAGCSTRLAFSDALSQTESVDVKKSSALTSLSPFTTRSKRPLEKHRQYSWTSRTTGLAAERQLPQAQLPPAPLGLVPDHLGTHEEPDRAYARGDLMGERHVETAAEVGDVHDCPAPGLEHAVRLGEDALEARYSS